MTYEEILEKLTGKSFFNRFAGLTRMRKTMAHFGNPEERLSVVHVAGTNGKGSVCAMLHSVLRAAGYKVGLFTSPYIHDFRERIQINGKMISKRKLTELATEVMAYTDRLPEPPNQFELLTIIALLYYEREQCDIVILETGLGGTFDPTNIVPKPLCSVIMNIGLDHCAILGNTLSRIADAKAGIIKDHCDVVMYPSEKEAMDVLTAQALKKNSRIHYVDKELLKELSPIPNAEHFRYKELEIELNLLGKHQQLNCCAALETIAVLNRSRFFISDDDITNGLFRVDWPVRMELLHRKPSVYLDGGHNPQCIEAAKAFFQRAEFSGMRIHVLASMLADKDYRTMLTILKSFAADIHFYRFDHPRAIPEAEIPALCEEFGMEAVTNPEETLKALSKKGKERDLVLIIGSLYLADRIRSIYKKPMAEEEACDEEQ